MKKAMTMILAAVMCTSMAVGVVARVPSCPECGGNRSSYTTTEKDTDMVWHSEEEHYDKIVTTTTYRIYECDDCGATEENVTNTRTETYCPA